LDEDQVDRNRKMTKLDGKFIIDNLAGFLKFVNFAHDSFAETAR